MFITFRSNNGTKTSRIDVISEDETTILPECSFAAPVYQKFKAWVINDQEYAPGSSITVTKDIIVTALWETAFTIQFRANGGSGEMPNLTVASDRTFTLPECSLSAPYGKRFVAWLINGFEYNAGSAYTMTGDTVAEALWETIPHSIPQEKTIYEYGRRIRECCDLPRNLYLGYKNIFHWSEWCERLLGE